MAQRDDESGVHPRPTVQLDPDLAFILAGERVGPALEYRLGQAAVRTIRRMAEAQISPVWESGGDEAGAGVVADPEDARPGAAAAAATDPEDDGGDNPVRRGRSRSRSRIRPRDASPPARRFTGSRRGGSRVWHQLFPLQTPAVAAANAAALDIVFAEGGAHSRWLANGAIRPRPRPLGRIPAAAAASGTYEGGDPQEVRNHYTSFKTDSGE
jgi:hypothetical protein